MTKSELLSFPNFGRKSLKEVEDVLSSAGFQLGMTLPPMETYYE
jgi:DNA-directed RNA polymerase alpha subunit